MRVEPNMLADPRFLDAYRIQKEHDGYCTPPGAGADHERDERRARHEAYVATDAVAEGW